MTHGVLAQTGIPDYLGLVLFAAIFVGSMILRARAEAKARERRMKAAQEEEQPEAVPPGFRAIVREIVGEAGVQEIPVARPVSAAPAAARRRPAVAPEGVGAGRAPDAAARAARRPKPARTAPAAVVTAEPATPGRVEGEPSPLPAEAPLAHLRSALEGDLTGGPPGLRKAILLSEILGLPRALRAPEGWLGGPRAGL